MKLVLPVLFCMMMFSCKEAPKKIEEVEKETSEMISKVDDSKYPEVLRKIFEVHGGIRAWQDKRILSFEIRKPDKTEKHTIDLYSRNEKIEMEGVSMGSEGEAIWLHDPKQVYKGDPVFYHNLMFYFYAMPFVLGDDGINYGKTEALEFEGISYPGVRISYDDGVGLSAKDEYYLHYNPKTFQMEWLGYTVTFRSGEKSENIKWIHYNDWMNVNGLRLPKSITWHEYEGRAIKEARDPVQFENITLSEVAKSEGFFSIPEGAEIMNPKE